MEDDDRDGSDGEEGGGGRDMFTGGASSGLAVKGPPVAGLFDAARAAGATGESSAKPTSVFAAAAGRRLDGSVVAAPPLAQVHAVIAAYSDGFVLEVYPAGKTPSTPGVTPAASEAIPKNDPRAREVVDALGRRAVPASMERLITATFGDRVTHSTDVAVALADKSGERLPRAPPPRAGPPPMPGAGGAGRPPMGGVGGGGAAPPPAAPPAAAPTMPPGSVPSSVELPGAAGAAGVKNIRVRLLDGRPVTYKVLPDVHTVAVLRHSVATLCGLARVELAVAIPRRVLDPELDQLSLAGAAVVGETLVASAP